VYTAEEVQARMLSGYLQAHQITCKLLPNTFSERLGDPAEKGVRIRYSHHLVLVREKDLEQATELVHCFNKGE